MIPFPISEASPIEHAAALPETADVVVIGGGVVGSMAALFLARKGLRVVLLEKGRIAGEQSSRNWGWIRQQGRDVAELPIMIEANQHWRELTALSNEDIGLVQGGVTYLAESQKELERYLAWLPHAQALGIDSGMLSRDEIARMIPESNKSWIGALHTASDMRAEPWKAVPALARLAAREGVTILENCAARLLDTEAGRVTGLFTERGRIATPEVVVAGGAWTSLFLRRHGVKLPQLSVRATVAALDAKEMRYPGGATDDTLAWRPRPDGGYSVAGGGFHELYIGPDAFRSLPKYLTQIRNDPFGTRFFPAAPKGFPDSWRTARNWRVDEESPFERMRVLNPAPNQRQVRKLANRFAERFPDLGPVTLKSAWAGMIDLMPDLVPVVDRVSALAGVTVACGMSGHGFGIGPGMGRVIADMVTGGTIGYDMHRFRLSRFSDGSDMELGPAL